MDKINKLSLPATILLGCIVLGGFYYATESNKQKSIERQQEMKLDDEKRIEKEQVAQREEEVRQKRTCVLVAEMSAQDYYKANCTYDCKEGQYYIATYEHDYNTCLQRAGLK